MKIAHRSAVRSQMSMPTSRSTRSMRSIAGRYNVIEIGFVSYCANTTVEPHPASMSTERIGTLMDDLKQMVLQEAGKKLTREEYLTLRRGLDGQERYGA